MKKSLLSRLRAELFQLSAKPSLSHSLLGTSTRRRRFRKPSRLLEQLETRCLLSCVTLSADCSDDHDDHDHDDHAGEHSHIDASGNEVHALSGISDDLIAVGSLGETTGDFTGTNSPLDLSQTFLLHSNPGANHTIFLDFDGHVTSGTSWNNVYTGGADFFTPAFNFEGDSTFTDNELARIQYIWQRVTEDFLPFDVNVTTQDPGEAALIKSGTGDSDWGIRVVIGGNGSWYKTGIGGVAYRNSFNYSSDTPVFVFEDNLGNGNEKYTAEASSHEAGHALGLAHDGNSSTSYYRGHGSGATGWAPIMGTAYYKELSQWSRGEYADANNTQDDLAIITTNNGFGYRDDDYGNTSGSAGALVVAGTSVSGSGIIERSSDVDVFTFSTGAGAIQLDVNPAARGPNLDILAELYDSSGTLMGASNPTSLLSASVSASVTSGVYYLHVSGVGMGDPGSTGYSDYASLGAFNISGTIVETTEVFPAYLSVAAASADKVEGDSSQTAFSFTVSRTGETNSSVSVDYGLTGDGTTPASASDFVSGLLPSGTVAFAPGETSKTVTVYVVGDLDVEADEQFAIALANASQGGSISNGRALGTIRNDDVPGVTVTPTSGLTVGENGSTASFTVVLDTRPSANVVISVQSLDTTEGTVNVSQLTFTPDNWNSAQTVTVTGVDDLETDGNIRFQIQLGDTQSDDTNYDQLTVADVSVTNQDNDAAIKVKGKKGGDNPNKGGGNKGGPNKSPAVELAASSLNTTSTDFGSILATGFGDTTYDTAETETSTDRERTAFRPTVPRLSELREREDREQPVGRDDRGPLNLISDNASAQARDVLEQLFADFGNDLAAEL